MFLCLRQVLYDHKNVQIPAKELNTDKSGKGVSRADNVSHFMTHDPREHQSILTRDP